MWAFANSPEVRRAIHARPIEEIGAVDECEPAAGLPPPPCHRLLQLAAVGSAGALPALAGALQAWVHHSRPPPSLPTPPLPFVHVPIPAGTNGQRIHYTHNVPSMLPVHEDLIARGARAKGASLGAGLPEAEAAARLGAQPELLLLAQCTPLHRELAAAGRPELRPARPAPHRPAQRNPASARLSAPLQPTGLTALIYSGDHDMAVPHTGSEAWTAALGATLGLERPWAPWFSDKQAGDGWSWVHGRRREKGSWAAPGARAAGGGRRPRAPLRAPLLSRAPNRPLAAVLQVAGYAVHYTGLVYATVRGAGHMVPENKPAEALDMLARFLRALRL